MQVSKFKVSKGAKIRHRYNQVPHLPQGYQWESDKLTGIHHKREPRDQPFPSLVFQHMVNALVCVCVCVCVCGCVWVCVGVCVCDKILFEDTCTITECQEIICMCLCVCKVLM